MPAALLSQATRRRADTGQPDPGTTPDHDSSRTPRPRRRLSGAFDQRSRQQRNHQLMMSGESDSAAAGLGVRPLHHVHLGTIMLEKIEIDSSEISQRRSE